MDKCKEGMIIGKNVYGRNRVVLLRSGYPLKHNHIKALANFGFPGVYVDDEVSAGIEIAEVVDSETRMNASMMVSELYENTKYLKLANTQPMAENVIESVADIVNQVFDSRDPVVNIVSLKTYDTYTYQHCVDVAILSVILGKELHLTRTQLQELGKAAIFHDIGKMQIPKTILDKPAALTAEEYEEMKKHSELGYVLTKSFLSQTEAVARGSLFHHEKFDGGGYPKGIKGAQIPMFARIIAIADAYDAIVSNRSYKKAMPTSEAYEYIMANSSSHFDPDIVNVFIRKIAPFPVGITVKLSNGREAIVVENRQNFIMRPLIKLIDRQEGDRGGYIDLAYDMSATTITVLGSV
ncbi:MAG: HD-GYP domain-containing protein [Defluviitaleaceae bacterium]|nr:HD-GYP domain-containing protein [Defluviitaleaceae bacterium]